MYFVHKRNINLWPEIRLWQFVNMTPKSFETFPIERGDVCPLSLNLGSVTA